MPGFLSRLLGGGKLTLAQRHKLLLNALDLHGELLPVDEVEAELRSQGAGVEGAKAISAEALERFESELLRQVSLPASARSDVNYYFLLGVTPSAGTEQVRRA